MGGKVGTKMVERKAGKEWVWFVEEEKHPGSNPANEERKEEEEAEEEKKHGQSSAQ